MSDGTVDAPMGRSSMNRSREISVRPKQKSIKHCGQKERQWFNRIHPDDIESVRSAMTSHLEQNLPHYEAEYRMEKKEGIYQS